MSRVLLVSLDEGQVVAACLASRSQLEAIYAQMADREDAQ